MRIPTGPLVAVDLMVLGVSALLAGEVSDKVLYGFLAILGGLLGTAGLWAVIGRWVVRRLEALEARTDVRHAENIQAQQKMWAFLLGVEGVGGMLEDQRRSRRMRHDAAQDITVLFSVAAEHSTQIARLSDKARVDFDPPSLERPRRRVDDD